MRSDLPLACNAGRRVDDVLDAGPRRRRRDWGEPSAPPPAARVARPRTSLLRINFASSNAPYKERTARFQTPSRSRAAPSGRQRARARNEHLPTARPDKHRRPVGRDQPASAEGRQVSQPSAKTVARGYGARHKALRKRWAAEVARGEVCCARCGRLHLPRRALGLGPRRRRPQPVTAGPRASAL